MKHIYLLRHAHTSSKDGVADHERSLSERGVSEVESLAKRVLDYHLNVDVALCSTANRCQQTYGYMQEYGNLPKPHYVGTLYLASAGDILSQIQSLDSEFNSVMIVGHNPGLADISRSFTRPDEWPEHDRDALIRFVPGTLSIARTEVDKWRDINPHNIDIIRCFAP